MERAVVITSIFEPSEAVRAYAELSGVRLIVVGDKKTPENWSCKGAQYISVEQQKSLNSDLVKTLPFNHYSRKMIGYLVAAQNGADIIIDTDDDNFPKSNWGFPNFSGNNDTVDMGGGFVNIYQWFTQDYIWPRGLPLDLIKTSFDLRGNCSSQECNVGVWQGLADEDPDVDAIYRLYSDQPCYFDEKDPVVLSPGTVCPFNSQNTAFRKELFPLLYLPAYVTFRFTDILRGLVAQPIMWLHGYTLGFTNATVLQERNPHDLMKDFASEIPMYLNCREVIEIVSKSISAADSLETNLSNAYAGLAAKGIVTDDEMRTLGAWLTDLARVSVHGSELLHKSP
jgi:hypothetical protein